jgi:hypothetical protein
LEGAAVQREVPARAETSVVGVVQLQRASGESQSSIPSIASATALLSGYKSNSSSCLIFLLFGFLVAAFISNSFKGIFSNG